MKKVRHQLKLSSISINTTLENRYSRRFLFLGVFPVTRPYTAITMAPTELANAVDVTLMQSDADVILQNEAESCSSVVPAGVFNGTIRFNFLRR